MKKEEYIVLVHEQYRTVKVLSQKNGASVLRLRHMTLDKDIIMREYSSPVSAYELLAPMKHRNLPEIYECQTFENGQVVLEEYVDGITVASVLECGRYKYKGAKKVIEGICRALITLHSLGIVHRDIKPENVIITTDGQIKLIDLGASRKRQGGRSSDTVPLGTVGYAPPEQYGISESNGTADIYALGVLLNVMLTGEHPSRCLAKGKAKHIILKCTSVSPEDRFSTVEKLIKAL